MILFTALLLAIEPFFLSWEKTTLFLVFFQRRLTALSDFALFLIYFTPLQAMLTFVFSFGVAYVAAQFLDHLTARLEWMRWELPAKVSWR